MSGLRRVEEAIIGARGAAAFDELSTLFTGDATRLRIARAPWVPFCAWTPAELGPKGRMKPASAEEQRCCLASGAPPASLRGRISLLTSFPGPRAGTVIAMSNQGTYPAMATIVRQNLLGAAAAARAAPEPPTVLWLLASKGSNLRRIADEAGLVEAVR